MAVRTKKPVALPLSSIVWKLLVRENVTWDDLEENDALYAQSLRGIRDIHLSGVTEDSFHEVCRAHCHWRGIQKMGCEFFYSDGGDICPLAAPSPLNCLSVYQVIPLECFEGTSWTGKMVPIVPAGRTVPLTFHNRIQYVDQAVNFRLHEMDLQVT